MTTDTKAPRVTTVTPDDVEFALNAMVPVDRVYENWIVLPDVIALHQQTLRAHIAAQAEKIAELTAELDTYRRNDASGCYSTRNDVDTD